MSRNLMLSVLLFLFNISFLNAQENWSLVKDEDNVKVYVSEDQQSEDYVNLKAITYAKGSVEAFASVMKDVPNYKKWMHAVEETFIVAQQSAYNFSYYMLTDFPWPASDRDAVINMKFDWNPETATFTTISRDVKGLVPEKEDLERVEEVKASYSFTKEGNNRIKIVYRGRIKPGVNLPDWLMEKVYHIAPFNTLKNLREYVLKEDYKNLNFKMDEI